MLDIFFQYNEAGKEEKYKDGLKYLIDIEEPPEAEPVTKNDNKIPTPFKNTVTTTEPKFLVKFCFAFFNLVDLFFKEDMLILSNWR